MNRSIPPAPLAVSGLEGTGGSKVSSLAFIAPKPAEKSLSEAVVLPAAVESLEPRWPMAGAWSMGVGVCGGIAGKGMRRGCALSRALPA